MIVEERDHGFTRRSSRTARDRTSGENLLLVCLFIAPPSQEMAPPANPGPFTTSSCVALANNRAIQFTERPSEGVGFGDQGPTPRQRMTRMAISVMRRCQSPSSRYDRG